MLYVCYTVREYEAQGVPAGNPIRWVGKANASYLGNAYGSDCSTSLAFWLGYDAEAV